MRVAIMQPTYLPWIGYFDLMDSVDHFVLLDKVQFSKRSWQQRNRIRTARGLEWLTVPVSVKGAFHQLITETRIANDAFIAKHLKSIKTSYRRSPHFGRYYGLLEEGLRTASTHRRLALLNITLIRMLAKELGVETHIHLSSELDALGTRSELLMNICVHLGANEYISPPGSIDYLRDDYWLFQDAGIHVYIQSYEHPLYRQIFEPFIPYTSAIDLLFNEGPAAAAIRKSGRGPVIALEEIIRDE